MVNALVAEFPVMRWNTNWISGYSDCALLLVSPGPYIHFNMTVVPRVLLVIFI